MATAGLRVCRPATRVVARKGAGLTLGDTHQGGDTDRDDSGSGSGPNRNPADMGQALRSAYQKMVDEAIPDEMLDLLGKLD